MSTPYNSTSNLISPPTPFSTPSLTSRSSLEATSTSSTSSSTSTPRDHSAAFGALSSTYGASGSAPKPIETRAARSSAPTTRAPTSSKKSWKERIFPASCQVAPLPPSTPSRTQRGGVPARDYEAAFGALQADYGLQGMAPQLNRQGQMKSL